MSPVVKNCWRRSACLRRKAATSFCSQSAVSSATSSSDFGSSIRFMAGSLGFAEGSLLQKFRCRRVRVALAPHEPVGKRAVVVRQILGEALQQHVFGGVAQPELGDRQPALAPGWGCEGDLPMPPDRVHKLVESE